MTVIGGWLFPALLSFAIAVSAIGPASASSDEFLDAGVVLEMRIEKVLEIYPAARLEVIQPACYSYGRALGGAATVPRILRHRDEISMLELNFGSLDDGGQLFRIAYERRVDPSVFDFSSLVEKLTRQYGPHTRVLHRRKMEPAGRIAGLEWRTVDGVSLRLVLQEDFRSAHDRHRISLVARSEKISTGRSRCGSTRCRSCIEP